MNEVQQLPEPESSAALTLRQEVSPERWDCIVRKALAQSQIVEDVRERCCQSGVSLSEALRQVSPKTPWPTFQYWSRRAGDGSKVSWENLLDRRIPPRPKRISKEVRASAGALRRVRPTMSGDEARSHLVQQHGEVDGRISDTSLLRIWREAGLVGLEHPVAAEVVEETFHGGAGLALIGAAASETGALDALARAVKEEGVRTVERIDALNLEVPAEPTGRDERGRLTAEYNRAVRAGVAPGTADGRWAPDYVKRQQRDLGKLQVLGHRTQTTAMKLLATGLIPLLTERRGFDGLDGPFGDWLGLLGGVAYKPATLDKFLAQLALLDVEDALWEQHASWSRELAMRWGAGEGQPSWLRVIVYIDASQDPHWTYRYAKSGKVSRTGRVGPCLTRVTVTSGPGVPILMETYAGTVSLKKELPRLLERVDGIIGEGELRRVTLLVVDAEMATPKLLQMLVSDENRTFITVLKGVNIAKDFVATSEWQSYRDRDKLREGYIVLHGEGVPKEGLRIRVVEMHRDGRNPHSTYFGTCADPDEMDAVDVATAYLSRWPHQEHFFRNARNGMGMDRSHGFGGETVHNVAYDTKAEEAERRVRRTKEEEAYAQRALEIAEKEGRPEFRKTAKALVRATKAAQRTAKKDLEAIRTTPREIYTRDTARENVVTALMVTAFTLIEFVLREYCVNLGMELRTFIEHFVYLPVTMVTSDTEIRYRIHLSARNSIRADQLSKACAKVTSRGIRRNGKTLVFEAVEPERKRLPVRLI